MPIPKPKSREKRSEFIGRCVSEVAKDPKFKDNKQRVAICYTQFQEAKASAEMIVDLGNDDEMLILKENPEYSMENPEMETPEMESEQPENEEESSDDYKEDLFGMSAASISSIAQHAQNIVNAMEDPQVKKNLQEAWLQGRIAIAEENVLQIHNFVMFNKED
jgi:hypothetical protein